MRYFIIILVLAQLFTSCSSPKITRPNILMIIGDDIGFSDIGCYGSEIQTPNLDQLAAQGIRFSQFYNMAKCNPTRSTLFTGLYTGGDNAMSFVNILNDAGYTTLISGKEHFDNWVPRRCYFDSTFDKSLTFWATTEYFIPPSGEFERPFYLNGKQLKASELESQQKPLYKTDAITDYALNWLDEAFQKDDPVFMLLPYHSAHYPLQARPEDIAKYRGVYKKGWDVIRQQRFERIKEMGLIAADCQLSPAEGNINKFRGHPGGFEEEREKFAKYIPWDELSAQEQDDNDLEMAVFAAMVDRMDQNIGRVLKKFEQEGKLDNTLILFFSDNGSCPYDSNVDFNVPPGGADSYRCLRPAWANVGNTPFRYFKQYGHEGGCNTHCIAVWPGVTPQGEITFQPAHVVDIFPTLLEILNVDYPDSVDGMASAALHGHSMLPILQGASRPEPEYLISGFTERFRMFRMGDWKLVRVNANEWELYNLKIDPTEINNLASTFPAKLDSLLTRYRQIQEEQYVKAE